MSKSKERLVEQRVTYTLELAGQFYMVENVPARVDEESGEQFFSPSTVERLYEMILHDAEPKRYAKTPVYEFAA